MSRPIRRPPCLLPTPAVTKHKLLQRHALPPALHRQFRLCIKRIDATKAQPGDDLDMIGDIQNGPDIAVVENADPADADAFGAGREPEVLDGADGGIDIRAWIMGAAQHHLATPCRIAGDADAERGLADAFELQAAVERLLLARKHRRRLFIGAAEGHPCRLAHGAVGNEGEVPRLHETNGGSGMRRFQEALDEIVRQRVWQELVAHITPRLDGAVDRFALLAGKRAGG
ncbi:hypothetical protein AT6N2_C0627 [Agrobacterium tumefaciens]|nr:hypothetical protein AT6N2_C0627 [Agrobacterium tumefaciens]